MRYPTEAEKKALLDNWRQLHRAYVKAGALVLELMRHPDVTQDMIMEMHRSYVRMHKTHEDVLRTLKQALSEAAWHLIDT